MGTSPTMGPLLVTLLFIISSIVQHINAQGCTIPTTGNFVGGTIRAPFQELDDRRTLNDIPFNYRAFLGITASRFDVTLRLVHKDPDNPAVLEPGDTFEIFYLVNEPTGTNLGTQTGYFLQLINSVDRDGQHPDPSDDINSLQYTLECTENNRPDFKTFIPVSVIFNDINDNTPIFTQTLYEGSVNELTPIGITVFQGLAYTDLDEGVNRDGDYAILPGDGSVFDGFTRFKIDVSSQGEVSVKNTLDFEVLNNAVPKRLTYQMNISITDRGQHPRTGYSTLALTVTDGDDLPPECLVLGEQFGYNDLYTCHCGNGSLCNTDTGLCSPESCQDGWYGPSCQKQNVALNKPTNQSFRPDSLPSSRAVDGDLKSSKHICSDSGFSANPFWLVNLQQTYPIGDVKIYYKDDRLDHFYGFSILVIEEDGTETLCFKHNRSLSISHITNVRCDSSGRYIKIINPRPGSNNHFISLCEVEVYICAVGTYGPDCSMFCYCANFSRCNQENGTCPNNECLDGWTGSSCNQECTEGMFGVDCSQMCHCYNNSTCHHVTGQCPRVCAPGWHGDNCQQEYSDSLPPESTTNDLSDFSSTPTTTTSTTTTVLTGDTDPSSDRYIAIAFGCLFIVSVLVIILLIVYFKRKLNLTRKSQEKSRYDNLAFHSNDTTTNQDHSGYLTVQETEIHPYVNGDIAANNDVESTYDIVL